MRNLLLFVFLSTLLSACGPDYLFDETYDLSEQGWTYSDTLDFSFSIEDSLRLYNLYLDVEHTTDYAYQNLYTRIYTRFPSGERKHKIVSLELADKAGVWQGDCGRATCRFLAPIQMNAFFNQVGPYTITLEQYMRASPTEGILKVGFKLEDVGKE